MHRDGTSPGGEAGDEIEDGDKDEFDERFQRIQSSEEWLKFRYNIQDQDPARSCQTSTRSPCWSHEQWAEALAGMERGGAASDTSDESSDDGFVVQVWPATDSDLENLFPHRDTSPFSNDTSALD
ncbi:unnamed protein product [Polarella glacialis]|uniref:Uncharacterized protein n=1 Tax=Polarella glacialis TaxID=89957 RepID=A0A813FAY6_POLGL|nr:unnamed protein product [Polarella glacialis]CAE8636083.1 unnamed protein product [Polarella glacialis]